jgi:hypothetical protein
MKNLATLIDSLISLYLVGTYVEPLLKLVWLKSFEIKLFLNDVTAVGTGRSITKITPSKFTIESAPHSPPNFLCPWSSTILDVFRSLCSNYRVTRCVREKVAQNVASSIFRKKLIHKFYRGKKYPNYL